MPTEAFYRQLSTQTVYQIYEERGLVDPPLVHEELVEALLAYDAKHFGPPSPLLSLPPELRNRIYEMVFEDRSTFDVPFGGEPRPWTRTRTDDTPRLHPLLLAKKQVYAEASGLWYGRQFDLYHLSYFNGLYRSCKWLESIGERNIYHLRNVRFTATVQHGISNSCYIEFGISLASDGIEGTESFPRLAPWAAVFAPKARAFQDEIDCMDVRVRQWETKHGKRLNIKGWKAVLKEANVRAEKYERGLW
ncbi:hypothetical protein LTR27_010439 [Elasticomyces elasticus]|nr:hypothetical protein LTR27_010439 [Elasticomyces elasticus]